MPHHTDGMPGGADPDDVFSSSTDLAPDVGLSAPNASFSATTDIASVRAQLQRLLDSKEDQLQQAGALGQRVLAQQIELEQRVRQLQEIDADRGEQDEPSDEMRLKYRELAKTIRGWDEENAKMSTSFNTSQRGGGAEQPPSPPSLPLPDLSQEAPSHAPSAPSASQSRRAKNAAHRANDVEFAFEIGSSLLTEVRRLQSLLAERDKAIQNMKEEKDDLEKAVESLRTALREQEQNADKFKEENWNLEVTLQEIRVQLADAQASAQRGESETKRLTKVLASTRESNDASKNEVERLQRSIEESKNKHETDVALHRKHAAALAREKSDLQQSVDTYKAELARASRRLPRFGSPYNTPGGMSEAQTPRLGEDDDDPFGPGTGGMGASTNRRRMDTSGLFPPDAFGPDHVDASPDPSPSRPFMSPNHPLNEIEALQQKLAHAQRQVNTLKGTLAREKELRIEYRRKMLEAGMQGQRLDEEEEKDEDVEVEVRQPKPKPRSTPFRGRGRGRGRGALSALRNGGRTLAQKLMAAQMHANEDSDEDEEVKQEESDAYPSAVHPDTTSDERTVDTSMTSVGMSSPTRSAFPASPSPEPLSNRTSVTSVEGMDPEFANILRRAPSQSSASRRGSPFARGALRSGRGIVGRRRGGTAFQEPRPSSLVGAPEALAAELGLANSNIGMESVREDVGEPLREMKEFACQTELKEPLHLPSPLPEPKPGMADMSAQAEAIHKPVPEVLKPETAEMSVQVEPEPEPKPKVLVPEMVEMAVQSDPIPDPEPTIIEVPVLAPVAEVPHVIKTDFAMQTILSELKNASTSTDPEIRPVLVDNSTHMELPAPTKTSEICIQTDPIPEPEPIIREVLVHPETPKRPQRSEAETQTTSRTETFPNTLPGMPASPLAQRRLRYLSTASNATAVPVRALQAVRDEDEDTDTDAPTELAYASAAEPETETDVEEYGDARSAAPTPTVTESVNDDDFHSMSTMTDNDYSDDDESSDAQSVRAPIPNQHAGASSDPNSERDILFTPSITYESMGIETDPPKGELKRELSEVSVQTDEWQPSPIISPVPRVPAGFGMYRVGPSSQQFQFISPTTPTPATALSTPVTPNMPSLPSNTLRDATNTLAARPMRFSSPSLPEGSKLASIEGTPDHGQRQHTQSLTTASPTVDKSRPPTMMLPPPPKMPPPPNSMPPPSFIPEKRRPTSALSSHRDMPPPRPSSPPPPELIQRATTPTFGSVLTVPNRSMSGGRQQGSSLPPMSVLRQPTSMNSFRSVAHSTAHAQMSSGSSHTPFVDRRLQSAASLLSDGEDMLSRRSSISSDFHHNRTISDGHAGATTLNTPGTPSRGAANMPSSSTDPTVIHAITQTMIGEFLYKYTRRAIGKGHGERRHKRFFWVHPYTKTLYWSSGDPGSTNVTEQSAKSAYIDSVRSVLDPNPMPPGLYQYSIVISTPQREMKFTAPTKERHEIWLNALNFLLARPTPVAPRSPTATQVHGPPVTPIRNPSGNSNILEQGGIISPTRTGRTEKSGMSNESPWSVTNVTPRGARRSRSRVSVAGSVGKRSGTPAAEYLRWTDGPGSPGSTSAHGFELSQGTELDDDELDFEIHDSAMSDREGYEGLENVRACCDGKHTVGRGHDHDHDHEHSHANGHKHTHIHRPIPQFARNDPAAEHLQPASRPSSPAFSFRSRSSRKSGDGVGNLFSRFGTRRSKTPAVSQGG